MRGDILTMDRAGDGNLRADLGYSFCGVINAKTTSYTVKQNEAGKVFSNLGAGAAIVFTLPVPKIGMTFRFMRLTVAYKVTITPPTGIKIQNQTAAQSIMTATANTTDVGIVTVVGISATEYMVMSESGPWTLNDGSTVI